MAIEKYTTEGVILESYDQGEHDRAFKVFTKDFGMIICHARSVRKLESKLRAHILPRSISLLTLVKGREVWRLTGAERKNLETPFVAEVVELLKRFVRGEGAHKSLYKRLIELSALTQEYDKEKVRLLIYYVLLVELGYADGRIIGAVDIKEYAKYSIQDLYTHLLLRYKEVRTHTLLVLKEVQL
ncbi:MAG: recombination protein O N-terminal domain-containing protein [Candidatus Pacebacteria bacterium]|nr:recombination protein O N-terminal domain-containing protein [Candidatus Paceibacterota bacterium]